MHNKTKVAACVILYNSGLSVYENLSTYSSQVEKIYILDNSDTELKNTTSFLREFNNVQYIYNDGNIGVATALNKAATLAFNDGFDYLLTMDDDSQTPPNMVSEMLSYLDQCEDKERIGILSGVHSSPKKLPDSQVVLYTMTSGNLLNLKIYKKTGPFRDDFFIDHVDHEYCLRLNEAGFQVVELPTIRLKHQLGLRKSSGWGSYQFISHSPLRGYYAVRNGWILATTYSTFRLKAITLIVKEWIKAILFEDQKVYRIKLLCLGLLDAWRRRLGKCSL